MSVNSLLLFIAELYSVVQMHHPFKDICANSSFWLLQIELFWTFVYRILCEHEFSFVYDNTPKVQLIARSNSNCMFCFIRNCQTFFQSSCIIYILTNNVWVIRHTFFFPNLKGWFLSKVFLFVWLGFFFSGFFFF